MAEEQNLQPDHMDPEPGMEGEGGPVVVAAPVLSKGMTPGQRLAAKKAQRSVEKKEFKEELKEKEKESQAQTQAQAQASTPPDGPALPEEVQKVARDFSDFAHENQGRILGGIAAFVIISAIVIFAQRFTSTGNAEAADALESAIEISTASVDAEDKDGKDDSGKPVFATREARTKKAAEAFASLSKKFGDDAIVPWAKLGEAAAQVELGAKDKARALYESAYSMGKGDPAIAARALEGLGITLEALGKTADATKRFEELKQVAGEYNKDTAEYHLARLKLAAGDRDGAKTLLKGLYDRLRNRPEGEPPSKYLKGEVEIRLAELDPALVDRADSTAGGGESFSQEQLEQLMQQLKMKGGMPPGGGAE